MAGNPWIQFVKQYATDNNIKYNEAMKSPDVRVDYLKLKGDVLPPKKEPKVKAPKVKKTGVKKTAEVGY